MKSYVSRGNGTSFFSIDEVLTMAQNKGFAPKQKGNFQAQSIEPIESEVINPEDLKGMASTKAEKAAEKQPAPAVQPATVAPDNVQKQLDALQAQLKDLATSNASLIQQNAELQESLGAAKQVAQEASNKALYMSKRGQLSDRVNALKSTASKLRDTDRKLTPAGYASLFGELNLDTLTQNSLEGSDDLAQVEAVLKFVEEYGIAAEGQRVSTLSIGNPLESVAEPELSPEAKAFIEKMGG